MTDAPVVTPSVVYTEALAAIRAALSTLPPDQTAYIEEKLNALETAGQAEFNAVALTYLKKLPFGLGTIADGVFRKALANAIAELNAEIEPLQTAAAS